MLLPRYRYVMALWMAVVVMGLAAGCQSTTSGQEALVSHYDEMMKAEITYQDDFEDGLAENWTNDQPAAWKAAPGYYQAQTQDDEAPSALLGGYTFTNFFAEMDYARGENGVGSGGLVIRASPDFKSWTTGSGYLFALGSDGVGWNYGVFRQFKGKVEHLHPWTEHPSVSAGTNRLGVWARDDLLQFYVNGELVWEGRDRKLASGALGLLSTSPESTPVQHYFHNVMVRVVTSAPPPVVSNKKKPDVPVAIRQTGRTGSSKDKSPLLRPGYLIQVTVLASGKREVDGQVIRVSDNNVLDLPLIGPVPVKGMTLGELNTALQSRYQEFFIEPQVLAEFVVEDRPDAISPWGSVVVLGRVRTPGRVNIPPTQDLTVSGAIQQAGGLDTSARASAIRLTRRTETGENERKTIDFTAIGQGQVENDLILKPGDVIFVPERIF
jgi:protein involved in polysaccharide export with SLBB domain